MARSCARRRRSPIHGSLRAEIKQAGIWARGEPVGWNLGQWERTGWNLGQGERPGWKLRKGSSGGATGVGCRRERGSQGEPVGWSLGTGVLEARRESNAGEKEALRERGREGKGYLHRNGFAILILSSMFSPSCISSVIRVSQLPSMAADLTVPER